MLYTNEAIKKRKNKAKKIKSKIVVIIYVMLIPILIYIISLLIQNIIKPNEMPSFWGIKSYVITLDSMNPELQIGDIVIVKDVRKDELKVGDIISFKQEQSVITQKITKILLVNNEEKYEVKGNNTTGESNIISYELIEGRVITVIPYVGILILLLQGKITIIIIAIIFIICLLYSVALRKRKKNRRIKRLEYEKNKKINLEEQ